MTYENDFFEYPVLTDAQIEEQRAVLEPGEYDFQVTNAKKEISKSSGNPMITLTLKVWAHDGQEFTLLDWLTPNTKMVFKIKHFWESVGKPEKYNGQTAVQEFANQSGKVKTKFAIDNEGKKRARVEDYVPQVKAPQTPFNDDIKF